MTGERLELVRSFDELRAGMLVVLMGCTTDNDVPCGKKHRELLLRREIDEVWGPVWNVAPRRSCRPFRTPCVSGRTVASGRLYRVVDPAMEQSQSTDARKPERVR